jgi:competence protein ComEC
MQGLSYEQASLLRWVGPGPQATAVEGVIDSPVSVRQTAPSMGWKRGTSTTQSQFELTVSRLRMGRQMQPCRGRIWVNVEGDCRQRRPGDRMLIYGMIAAFRGPTNPGEADFRDGYRQRQLHASVSCENAGQLVWLNWQPSLMQRLAALMSSIASQGRESLLRHMNESSGPLAAALVLGQREFVDESTRDQLLVTGTAHLLSVSGLHLAIVVVVAGWVASIGRFPLVLRIGWILLVCVVYTLVTGAKPPVVRASILVGTLMIAVWIRRPGQPINTLSLAALILLAINPSLLFNLGVQLSFLAVATLMTCGSLQRHSNNASGDLSSDLERQEAQLQLLVEQGRSRVYRWFNAGSHRLRQAIWFSLCVTAMTSPLTWQSFHVVSLVSVAVNVILGPFVLVALASGVTAVVIGFVWEPLMLAPAFICDVTMEIMQRIIGWAASLPGGHVWLPSPPGRWVVLFYLVMAISLVWVHNRRASWFRYLWIGTWTLTAWCLANQQPKLPERGWQAIFVDVGHGTCVVLRSGDDETWLYDCGRLGNVQFSSHKIDSVLWSLGVTRLSGIFLSHADADHYNALPGLLRRFDVEAIYTPPDLFADRQPGLALVADEVRRRSIAVHELSHGMMLKTAGPKIDVLHPPAQRIAGSDNANSLVLRVEIAGGRSLVLPGDLETPGTEILMETRRPQPGGILMAPHHGSLTTEADAVLPWSRPAVTIVSGGARARRPEVSEMLSQTGSAVHVTSQEGAIRVDFEHSGRVYVRSWMESPW